MSESIKRRNSSRQLLQNLIRVTAQRSQEDAEEVERERRRRARERQRGEGSPSRPEATQYNDVTHNTESDEELKPSCRLVLDEDEGFSDWSNRLENRHDHEVQNNYRAKEQRTSTQACPREQKEQEHGMGDEEAQEQSRSDDASTQSPEKTPPCTNATRTSYSSSVFMSHDARPQHSAGRPAERTSYLAAGTMRPRGGANRVDGEAEQELQKENRDVQEKEVHQSLQDTMKPTRTRPDLKDEDQEAEEPSFTHEENEDLSFRTEEQSPWREEDDEQMIQNKRSVESRRRRTEEVNRSSGSFCSSEGEESLNCYGPMSPTFKKLLIQFYPDEVNSRVSPDGKCTITERTESLKRSTSSVKKTQPPVPVCKIDKKLEQYTHALEVSSKECRSSCQVLTDLTTFSEPVASKKNLFEAGEAWNQNAISVTPSKDADGLKVGVADLINQWVRGSEDGSGCSSASKPADIKPGGVLNKKNLWESLGDAFSAREGKDGCNKMYKYLVTGHGKYEKVSAENNCGEAEHFYEDL